MREVENSIGLTVIAEDEIGSLYTLSYAWKPVMVDKMHTLTAAKFPRVFWNDVIPKKTHAKEMSEDLIAEFRTRDAMLNEFMAEFIGRFQGNVSRSEVVRFIRNWDPDVDY
jgi:hypothetical protein